MLKKLKSLLLDDTIYMAFLLVIVAVASFGLGRLSVTLPGNQTAAVGQSMVQMQKSPELLTNFSSTTGSTTHNLSAPSQIETGRQNYVASKSGTKYHALSCPGAKQIKDTNKIFFATVEEAEAAGYTRAANCKF